MANVNYQIKELNDNGGTIEVNNSTVAVKMNNTAIAPPVVTSDYNQGYSVGSLWIDSTNNKAYVCEDNTSGSAVWLSIVSSDSPWDYAESSTRKLISFTDNYPSLVFGNNIELNWDTSSTNSYYNFIMGNGIDDGSGGRMQLYCSRLFGASIDVIPDYTGDGTINYLGMRGYNLSFESYRSNGSSTFIDGYNITVSRGAGGYGQIVQGANIEFTYWDYNFINGFYIGGSNVNLDRCFIFGYDINTSSTSMNYNALIFGHDIQSDQTFSNQIIMARTVDITDGVYATIIGQNFVIDGAYSGGYNVLSGMRMFMDDTDISNTFTTGYGTKPVMANEWQFGSYSKNSGFASPYSANGTQHQGIILGYAYTTNSNESLFRNMRFRRNYGSSSSAWLEYIKQENNSVCDYEVTVICQASADDTNKNQSLIYKFQFGAMKSDTGVLTIIYSDDMVTDTSSSPASPTLLASGGGIKQDNLHADLGEPEFYIRNYAGNIYLRIRRVHGSLTSEVVEKVYVKRSYSMVELV